jgi:E3 ubiquitin-protein ligase BRE1
MDLKNTVAELRELLIKRDAENARIRDERDKSLAEVHERRARDNIKLTSAQDYKAICQSQAVRNQSLQVLETIHKTSQARITALQTEVARCKGKLAANAGKDELILFFAKGDADVADFWKSLETRLKCVIFFLSMHDID